MWLGWALIDETELVQLDFFDLCEPSIHSSDSGLESQTENEENDGEKV
jgi:hypothetical protein